MANKNKKKSNYSKNKYLYLNNNKSKNFYNEYKKYNYDNYKNNSQKNNKDINYLKDNHYNKKSSNSEFAIKIMTFIGTIIVTLIILLIMKYFFVDRSNIGINYSTDKKLVYITLEGQDELIATQKYISDSGYNMRYDVERFKVFRYKEQDIYRFIDNAEVVVLVEKSSLPNDCNNEPLILGYSNCYKFVDNTTDEYYISKDNKVYRIVVKTPNTTEYKEGVRTRISYMINSFEIR